MKTLSLKQPFAELVVSGKKTIELRKWNTKFRGKFLIHASKIPDSQAMKKFGFEKWNETSNKESPDGKIRNGEVGLSRANIKTPGCVAKIPE